jgi:hyperosmotically inducible protein
MRTQILAVAMLAALGLAACERTPSGSSATPSPADGSRSQPTVGEVLDDATITAKVKAALVAAKNVNGMDISVETTAGRVILSGVVPNQSQVDRAVATARAVEGVVDVEARLTVSKG